MDGSDGQDADNPTRSRQVDTCLSLRFLLYTVNNAELETIISDSSNVIFLSWTIIVNISVHVASAGVDIDQICVPGCAVRVCDFHDYRWIVILLIAVVVPGPHALLWWPHYVLVAQPAYFVVVLLDH